MEKSDDVFLATYRPFTEVNHHILQLFSGKKQDVLYGFPPVLLLLANRRPHLSVTRIRSRAVHNHLLPLFLASILHLENVIQRPEVANIPILRHRTLHPLSRTVHLVQAPEQLRRRHNHVRIVLVFLQRVADVRATLDLRNRQHRLAPNPAYF